MLYTIYHEISLFKLHYKYIEAKTKVKLFHFYVILKVYKKL